MRGIVSIYRMGLLLVLMLLEVVLVIGVPAADRGRHLSKRGGLHDVLCFFSLGPLILLGFLK